MKTVWQWQPLKEEELNMLFKNGRCDPLTGQLSIRSDGEGPKNQINIMVTRVFVRQREVT